MVRIPHQNVFLYTVNYFDDKYRLIQAVSRNYQGGLDRLTSKLDFVGKVLATKTRHSTGGPEYSVERSFQYDHAGRLLQTTHRLNGGESIVISKNEYNELGQLVTKKLHGAPGSSSFKQTLDYRYNIRGWLTSINDSDNLGGDYFGMKLGYNESIDTGNDQLFNGNISGMRWSTNLGLGAVKERAYNYSYDSMNRILAAAHKIKGATWTSTSAFSESNYQYDLNGNIQSLLRKDASGNDLDNLSYNYGAGALRSNALLSVSDNGNVSEGFKDAPPDTNADYAYDQNGNMVRDLNKNLEQPDAIKYNHLNLPISVQNRDGDFIRYTYDASGKKLRQEVLNGSGVLQKKTDYVGEFFYENDTLKFVNTEEGRVVMTGTAPEYQYHLKDHLGNVRMTFTTKNDIDAATATLENANIAAEQGKFLDIDKARRVNARIFDHTYNDATPTNGAYSTRLSGSANEKIGLARSLSVMPGDTITVEVYAKYVDPNAANDNALVSILTAIANNVGVPSGTIIDSSGYSSAGSATYPFTGYFTPGNSGTAPKAYLNYLVFDRNFAMKDYGFRQISTLARETGDAVHHAGLTCEGVSHERLAFENSGSIKIKEPGYVYIWLSNEEPTAHPVEVFFDDFKVTHTKSPVIQSDDYYPFGLSFNSYQRENAIPNQYQYNGKELQDELGLGLLDYVTRQYDPAIGRFLSVDPATEIMKTYSPYTYSFDNPIRFHDKDGMIPEQATDDPPDIKKIQSGPRIDMQNAPAGSGSNAAGYPRNGPWFWRQMLSEHPEMFSQDNAAEIRGGRSPRIDDKWIDFNPSHAAYKGDKLIHHHINQGNMATGIPEQVHRQFSSELHGNMGGKPKVGGGLKGALGGALNFLGAVGLAIDFLSNDPHALNMQFSAGAKLNTLYYDDQTEQYFQVTERGKEKDSNGVEREYSVYNTYSGYTYNEDSGKYEGVNKTGSYRAIRVKSLDQAYQVLNQAN